MKQDSTVPFVTIAAVHQYESSSLVTNTGIVQVDRRGSAHSLGVSVLSATSLSPAIRESRRKSSKSSDKDETRGDSGKITDISETSTTDDYATAYDNSGTDTSSKRSTRQQQHGSKPGSKEGSSFESASSAHSFARDDALQAVPSSPPPIAEENTSDVAETEDVSKSINIELKEPEEKAHTEEKEELSVSAESSSSGSYSLDSGQREQKTEWTDQERRRIRKGFKLDLSDHSNEPEAWSDGGDAVEKSDDGTSSQRVQSKAKFTSVPVRRTQQGQTKKWSSKGNGDITPKMVRSPAMPEGFRTEDWAPPQRSTPSHTPEEVSRVSFNALAFVK